MVDTGGGLENRQLSLQATMQFQVLKHLREAYNADEERARVLKVILEERRLDPTLYKPLPAQVPATVTAAPIMVAAPTVVPQVPKPAVVAPPIRQAQDMVFIPNKPPQVPRGYNVHDLSHIVTSTEQVSARFLKLKGELLNMFYMMPEKSLRLPELDEAGEQAIADAGNEAANNIRAGLAKISNTNGSSGAAAAPPAPSVAASAVAAAADKGEDSGGEGDGKPTAASGAGGIDFSQSNVERLADKAARKAKRRMRRKLSMDKFLQDVQTATTPQQLLDVVISLEGAIPQGLVYKYSRKQLPLRSDTLAETAVRLYALDRAIAYDDIKGVENNYMMCHFRLRSLFYPRCMQSSSCNRSLGHCAKCNIMVDNPNGSRIPDFQDTSNFTRPLANMGHYYQPPGGMGGGARPGGSNISNNNNMSAAAAIALANQRRAAYMQQMMAMKPRDEEQPLEEILKKLLQTRKELDIENIQPYMPNLKDITEMEWI